MSEPSGESVLAGDGPPDAQLVAGVLARDREAFGAVYDRYGDRLYDFAHSMLRQREEAEDAVADSFVIVAERLGQLRDPDRLRPWLYAIVRSECLRRLKARTRIAYGGDEQLVDMADTSASPESEAEMTALRELVWDASAGLAERDRAMLDLHLRHGLEGAELGEAMGVSANNAYVMLSRVRTQVERSLGALLIARLGRDECDDLDGLLADWDGRFSPLVRKRVARHVDDCDVCSDRRRMIVSPLTLLSGVPILAAPLSLRDRVLEDTALVAHTGPTGGGTGGSRRRNQAIAAGAAAVVVAGAAVLLWPGGADEPTPTAVSEQATSTPTTPAPDSPSATPSSPAGAAGMLAVSTQLVDLGLTKSSATVRLTNGGDKPVDYSIATSAKWLSVAPGAGRLTGGQTVDVRVSADRSRRPEGLSNGSLTVSWSGGQVPVAVRLSKEQPPTVGGPSVVRTACGQGGRTVIVTTTASDDTAVDQVELAWSGPAGSGRADMSPSGQGWSVTIGPFSVGGTLTLQATAKDERDNAATGPSTKTTVDPCPQ